MASQLPKFSKDKLMNSNKEIFATQVIMIFPFHLGYLQELL